MTAPVVEPARAGEPSAGLPADAAAPDRGRVRDLLLRIGFVAVIDALAIAGLVGAASARAWGMFGAVLVGTLAANVIYLGRRAVPAKYLFPGLVFLLVFQVYVVLYTGYASITNDGDGRNLTQEQALERILAVSERRVPDSPTYPVTVVADGDELALLVTHPDDGPLLGTEDGLAPLPREQVTVTDGRASAVEGYRSLALADLARRQQQVLDLRVPLGDDPTAGSLRTDDGSRAYVARSALRYDPVADTLTDTDTGLVYADDGRGAYRAADGSELSPGWRVVVGADNYTRLLQDERIRGPLLGVFVWTFVFAAVSVGSTFALGLGLALLFNDDRMRGRRLYRSLLVLPYAVPSFLSILVWTGMLNTSFGFVNQVLLGGAAVPWLSDAWLARGSVLLVNLWLGFPYMFLVCTGALQGIPSETLDAARVDGAGPVATVRRIVLPLVLVTIAPLLIASFAFNFNNFTVIYFITRGGPSIPEAPISVGSTDLLISLVYKLSFGGTGAQWGFAAAVSVLIFVIVAVVSAISFARTRRLEELA